MFQDSESFLSNSINEQDLNLDYQISNIAQNILEQNYNKNIFQSYNQLQAKEEITNPITENNNLYFIGNQEKDIPEPIIRTRKDKFDIARRKLKNLVLKNVFNFIQEKSKYKYQLFKKISYHITKEKKVDEEKAFIEKSLGEIFSGEVSAKYTTIKDKKNTNKDIISNLSEGGKNIELINILNIKFIDCLNHFMGFKKSEPLSGMTEFGTIIFKDKTDKNNLLYYAKHYEEKILSIKPRNTKNRKTKKEKNKF